MSFHEEFESFHEGDDPTQVLRVMEDYEHSRRQSLLSRRRLVTSASDLAAARRESLLRPPPRQPNFASASSWSPFAAAAAASSNKRSRESGQFPLASAAKTPRLGPLGPDPLEGLSALRDDDGRRRRARELEEARSEAAELRSRLAVSEASLAAERTRASRADELARRAESEVKRERAAAEERASRVEAREREARREAEEVKHQAKLRRMREERRAEAAAEEREGRRRDLDEVEAENEDLAARVRELEGRLGAAEDAAAGREEEARRRAAEARREAQALRTRLDEAAEKERLADGWRSELGALRKRLQTTESELAAAQREAAALRESARHGEEAETERRAMRDRLRAFPGLERERNALKEENKLLRDTMENVALLKEEAAGLQSSLRRSEARVSELEAAEVELHSARAKAAEWEECFRRIFGGGGGGEEGAAAAAAATPHGLEARVIDIRKADVVFRGEMAEIENKLKAVEADKKTLEENATSTQASLAFERKQRHDQGILIKKLQRKLTLVCKERDSYKGILDSYEHEITFTGGQFDRDKTAALEKVVANYKDTVDKLEAQLAATQSSAIEAAEGGEGGSRQASRVAELEAALASSRKEREALQEQLDRLEQGPSSAAAAAGPGEMVLHLRQNPTEEAFAVRQREVATMQEENEALKARVKLLEEGHTSNITMMVGQKVDEAASSEEVKELKEQLRRADLRKDRIMEAFKKTSKDFREVCHDLTGYRIDGLDNGQYRLTPKYADQDGDHLLFQRTRTGELLLLETRFSHQLGELMELHLNQQHSIPVFLAAVITDLFSRRTFDTAEYQTEEEEEEEEEAEDEGDVEEEEDEEEEPGDDGDDEGEVESEGDPAAGDDDDPICID